MELIEFVKIIGIVLCLLLLILCIFVIFYAVYILLFKDCITDIREFRLNNGRIIDLESQLERQNIVLEELRRPLPTYSAFKLS